MKNYRSIALVCGLLSFGLVGEAYATCMKPVGTYAGVFSGAYYDSSGALLEHFATDVTLTISAAGSGTEVEYGKQLTVSGIAKYAVSNTFSSFAFIPTTCRGAVTMASGQTFSFSVVDSGKEIQITDYSGTTAILVGAAVLKRI